MSIRRATPRAASAIVAVASVLLLATCDIATLTKPNEGGTPGNPFDSTELTLGLSGTVLSGTETILPLGGTGQITVTSATVSLLNVVKRYYSAGSSIIVDSITGDMHTGAAVGTPTKITAMILAPELGEPVTISKQVRVRYNGLKFTTPLVTDTIKGLGPAQNKTAAVFGTNAAGANVLAITPDSIRSRDTTVFRITGTAVSGRKTGTAYLVGFFDGLRDSVLVRVRQVAKNITFPTADYTARHMNFGLTVPIATVTDLTDSLIPVASRVMKWRTKDTTKAAVDSLTGVLRVKVLAGDTVFAKMDTVERKQRIVVSQVVGSLSKFQGDARSDTVAKNVTVVPTVTALDSGGTAIVGASVTFRTGIGLNASVNDTLPITTNAQGRAAPTSWKLGDVAGTNSNTLVATSGAQSATFTVTAVPQKAFRLAFTVNPTSASINGAINPAITVRVTDSLGNIVASTANVTLAIGNNPGASTLGGTLTQAAVAGVATFSTITLNQAGSGYTLQASSASLLPATSNGFDIFGIKNKLGFTTQPATTSAGAAMANVRVAIQDAAGNTVGNATDSVTIAFNANPGASTLGGTTKVAAVNGVATFSTLTVSNAAAGYTFAASTAGLISATSTAFTVTPVGAPAKLGFSVQPANVVSGAPITPSIKVQIQDAAGALVTGSTQQVTLSIETTSPTGGVIGGTVTRNAIAGVVTFDDITITKAATGYKLLANAVGSGLTTATSTTFNVTPGTATKLGWFQQPSHTIVSTSVSPAVVVEVQDANSNRVTTGTFNVSLTMSVCTGTLTGGGTQATASGIATFSTLSNSVQTTGCLLTAAASGLANSPSSTAFNIVATNGPVKLAFTTEPSATVIAGSALATAPVVNFQDNASTNVTATATTVSISILSGPQTAFSSGGAAQNSITTSATFSGLVFNTAGTYRLLVSATGYDPDTSAQIVVSSSTANRVGFVTMPVGGTAGVPFANAVQVAVQDQFGNTVLGSTNTITVSATQQVAPSAGARFQGNSFTAAATASNGVATFTGLAQRTSGASFRMFATSPSLSAGSTGATLYDMTTAPATALGFTTHPNNTATPTIATVFATNVLVAAQDSVGNTVTDFSNAITVSYTGGTAGATLGGTKTLAPVSGVATFNNLTLDKLASNYQLVASASGMGSATGNVFEVHPFWLTTCCLSYENSVILGSTLYFVGGSALKSVPLSGGTPTTIAGSTNAYRIATDGTNIYWAEWGPTNNGDAFIKKLTVATTTVSTLTTAQTNMMDWAEAKMFSDGVNVFFVSRNLAANGLAIKSVPVGAVSVPPTELFANTNNFGFPKFGLNLGSIYFFDPSTSTIKRVASTGGTPTAISTAVTVTKMAFDGTTLYFADGVTIKSIPNAASAGAPVTPTNHATAPGTIYELAVDGGNLWVNADGIIMKYPTSNFANGVALNSSSAALAIQWYGQRFDFDGTYMYSFYNHGRFGRIPK